MSDFMETSNSSKQRVRNRTGALYSVIRRVHLYCGLILATFIAMYFLTGVAIVHHDWFGDDPEPVETRSTHRLDGDLDPSSPDFSEALADRLGIDGRRNEVRSLGDDRWQLAYFRPGLIQQVTVEAGPDRTVTVLRREQGFRQTLVGFHRMHGFGGGWFFTMWGVMMDLVNLSMVVFGLTGIYMWWKLMKRHALGWLLLIGGYAYSAAIVAYLLYGR